jgi:hypothetical protein
VFCIDIGGDLATEVLMAAHYLSIRGLHDLACRMIAANIEGIETLVGLPPESVLQIFSYLPPVKLLYAEQHSGLYPSTTTTTTSASTQTTTMAMTSSSPFLQQQHHQYSSSHRNPNRNSGFFDTGFLWKRAFEREGWGVDEYPYENSWKVSLLKMVIHNDPAVCDIHPTIHRLASHRFISPDGIISTLSKKMRKGGAGGGGAGEGGEEEEEDTGSDEDRPLHESDIFGKRDEGIPWKHLYLQREFQNRVDRYFRTLDVAAASGASQYPSLRATLLTSRVEFGVTTSSSHSPSRAGSTASPPPQSIGSTGGPSTVFSSLTSALSTAGVISHKSSPPHNLSSSNSRTSASRVLETDFVGCISIPSIVGDEKSVSMIEKEVTARRLRLSWADGLSDFIRTFENLHFLDLSNHSCLFNTTSTPLSSLEGMLAQEGDALIQWLTSESRISSLRFSNCGLGDGFIQRLLELTSCSTSSSAVASSFPSTVGRRKRNGILAWTSLDLFHNNLTSKGLDLLCQVLFPNFSSSSSTSFSSTSNSSRLPLKLVNISLAENKIRSSWRPNVENVLSQVCFALSRTHSLRMLDLRRNELHLSQISSNALEALATNSSLTYLLLDGNTFMGGQMSASSAASTSSLSPPVLPKSVASPDSIRTFLSYLPLSLQHLGLSNCGLSSIHLGFLVSSLNKGMDGQRHITSLDLSDNNFRDSEVFISTLLKQYQSLTSLDLGDSHLWDVGGTAIANSLADSPSLTYLNLERNTLRHSSLAVANSVANNSDASNLRTLNLDDNQMSASVQNQVKSLLANSKINLILNS